VIFALSIVALGTAASAAWDNVPWLTVRQVGSLASQTKIYECQVYAVHARALLRIASGVITTTDRSSRNLTAAGMAIPSMPP
jgi:hypothetical protein